MNNRKDAARHLEMKGEILLRGEHGIMMKRKLIRRAAAALSAALILTMTACGGNSAPEGGTGEGQEAGENQGAAVNEDISADLTMYTSEPEELVADMIARFNETYPNVNIELFRAGSGKLTAKMDAELETGETEANLIWFADIGYMKGLDDKGMILHYTSKNADKIDDSYIYNDGMGTEVRLIYNVIAYNTSEITDAPKDWNDVTGEDYKDTFAMADPYISGGALTALVAHIQNSDLVGWDWYDAVKANGCKYEESNGNLQAKVATGEYKAAELVDFMARQSKAEGSPVDICYPESGAVLVPTPIAIMNNIPEESVAGAQAFIDWCLSDEGQEMFVEQQYIPVNPDVEGPEGAPAAADIKVLPFDLEYFVANSAALREEYGQRYGTAG